MKRLFLLSLVLVIVVGVFTPSFLFAKDDEKVEYVLFHLDTCGHCKDEIKFINNKLMPKYGDYIDFRMYEVSESESQEVFEQYGFFYEVETRTVPMAFIDGYPISGYGSDKTTGKKIMDVVESKLSEKGLIEEGGSGIADGEGIVFPVIGEINVKSFSLPLLTVIVGLLDGFNPCAMWVLLFLISLLLGMEDRRRMWLLGSIFIFASGIVYFIFMAAWLQLLLFVGMIGIIRLVIGLVAVAIGGKNLKDYWDNRKTDGVVCKVSKNENTQKTFGKIKDIVYRKSLWWSILGIILLGFSVNLVELACSAGFPAIYTQVLAISGIPMWQRYLYMAGYILFYMLDDLVIFIIAMATLKSKVVGGKYAKYANLVGGLLIFVLGLLLIFKPEWLMFS